MGRVGVLLYRGVLGVIAEVPPDGSFPALTAWSPSCRKCAGSRRAGRLIGSGGLLDQRGEGRWDVPTLNTAGAGSGSTASSATTPAASAGASGTTSAGAVTG